MQRSGVATAWLAIGMFAGAACGAGAPSLEQPPNVILVIVDTLRADHMEAYGYPRQTAPSFALLAATGVRFEHAISQAPWTLPAMASVHSSLYPSQHGAIEAETAIPEASGTLAEQLQSVGYRTVAVVSHRLVGRQHGFAQGFEVFDETHVLGHGAVTSEDLTLTALARLQDVNEPFFLWVHYFDPHITYVRHQDVGFADGYGGALPDELTARRLLPERNQSVAKADLDYIEAVYDEEIAHTDMWIGRLWEALDSNYGADRNVFVFTADHGEYFLERGRFFHGKDAYDALVHVPLLIAGAIEPELRGTTVAGSVETRSIAATVMGLLGMRDHAFGGQDLLEVARGASAEPAFTEGSHAFGTDARKLAVVHDGWKLIHHLDTGRYELYELASDPGERSDRWEAESESEDGIVASLK